MKLNKKKTKNMTLLCKIKRKHEYEAVFKNKHECFKIKYQRKVHTEKAPNWQIEI